MSNYLCQLAWANPIAWFGTLLIITTATAVNSPKALANPGSLATSIALPINTDSSAMTPLADPDDADAMAQVTAVSQLSDVKPTDWAFQALQSLVERYGCIAGYPDKNYRGNRALTRYEFAAGLNACLDRVNELIAAATTDLVKKADLATLQKLQEEFAAELATLRGRVDALEAKTATLEKQQFSTTTKLNAEAIFGIAGVASSGSINGQQVSRNTIVGDRVRLNFEASFTGKDLLRTRLQAANLNSLPTDRNGNVLTPEGGFRFAGNGNNNILLDQLLYQFPVGEKTMVAIDANAGAIDDFTDTLNPFLDNDGSSGALTHFGTRNSIYYLVNGTGVGVRHTLSNQLELSVGYLANNAANPAAGNGLLNGAYGAIAQVTFKPNAALALGLTYIHAYNNDFSANGSVGSTLANFRSTGLPFSANAFGAEISFKLSPKLIFNGNVGYTNARSDDPVVDGKFDIWNWAVGLAVPDLGKKGSLAGVIVGMEPKVTGSSGTLSTIYGQDPNTSLHIEGFYQYALSDQIAITPGIIWLTAPNHNNANGDVVIGTIRTTFTF